MPRASLPHYAVSRKRTFQSRWAIAFSSHLTMTLAANTQLSLALTELIQRWGFIPSTKGEDGDPLDALVIHEAATAPGLVLKCKVIGVLEVLQSEKGKKPIRNDRLIAVPRDSHREKADKDARDLPKPMRDEIEKFFVATDELEDKELKFLGWKGPKAGRRLIQAASKSYKEKNGDT